MSTTAQHLADIQARERATAERRELHARALRWSRENFPERVEAGHACPFAAMYALEEKRRRPGGPVSVVRVRARLEAHDARHAEPTT